MFKISRNFRLGGLAANLSRLAVASGETVFRRSLMMARGTCLPAEYKRMVDEKMAAVGESTLAAITGGSAEKMISPFLKRAAANAKRLRKGK